VPQSILREQHHDLRCPVDEDHEGQDVEEELPAGEKRVHKQRKMDQQMVPLVQLSISGKLTVTDTDTHRDML